MHAAQVSPSAAGILRRSVRTRPGPALTLQQAALVLVVDEQVPEARPDGGTAHREKKEEALCANMDETAFHPESSEGGERSDRDGCDERGLSGMGKGHALVSRRRADAGHAVPPLALRAACFTLAQHGYGAELYALPAHRDRVLGVAFLPDGRRAVSGGRDGTLKLWDLRPGASGAASGRLARRSTGSPSPRTARGR